MVWPHMPVDWDQSFIGPIHERFHGGRHFFHGRLVTFRCLLHRTAERLLIDRPQIEQFIQLFMFKIEPFKGCTRLLNNSLGHSLQLIAPSH